MERVLIIGSEGQDGRILTGQLRERGIEVARLARNLTDVPGRSVGEAVPLVDAERVASLIREIGPDAIFYLAAFHHSSDDIALAPVLLFEQSFQVHVDGWLNVLEVARFYTLVARIFYAASSHCFGRPDVPVQDERTPFQPDNAYGITKTAGVHIARYYRDMGTHVSVGLLYNHESELRAPRFVSQRIVRGAVQAAAAHSRGERYVLELGDLGAVVDWGYAPDYTAAMQRIVEHPEPADYVVASGVPHTVMQFCEQAFAAVGLDAREHVRERAGRITKRLAPLVGDASRLRRATGWRAETSFAHMVSRLVSAARGEVP